MHKNYSATQEDDDYDDIQVTVYAVGHHISNAFPSPPPNFMVKNLNVCDLDED